ncbi:hypothetical protein GCM10027592_42460 [Spirosoma flavus]
MKHVLTTQSLTYVTMLLALLQSCRPAKQEVSPTDDVKLLGISIPGFPSENIAIDQGNKQVVLTVPTNVTTTSFEAKSYQTSANSSIWNEQAYPISLCRMPSPDKQLGIYVLNDANKLSIYKIAIKPAGNLQIGFIDNQTTATIAQPLGFQIENFLDGTSEGQIILTRTDATERDTLRVGCCSGLGNCITNNQFDAGIAERVRPGEYTVEIRKANGRQAIAKQKLTFRKGTPLLEKFQFQTPVMAKTRALVINGENLFADDSPELLVRRVTGESFRLRPTVVSTFGRTVSLDLPAEMTPGYYYAQLVIRGQAVGATYRMTVLRQPEQPSVFSIDTLLTSPSANPLVLQRTRHYSAHILPEYEPYPDKLDVKLTDINSPDRAIVFRYRTGRYNSDYPGGLKIPDTVAPGNYTLRIVATYPNGTVVESEPLERYVVIQ